MARFFGIAREEITRYGGTVEKFIGDAVMAIFGLPAIHEDDAVRAARAALAVQARLEPDVVAGSLPAIRIGINTGEVVADRAAVEKSEFLVTGEPVNLAARLQQHARPAQIVVGESTHAATRWAFEYLPLPPIEVKGWQQRVIAYQCLRARVQPAVERGLDRGVGSPLVGRDREFATLQTAVERVMAGQGGIAAIIGDAGLGKSRLLAEVRRQFDDRGLRWLEGHTLSFGQSISYWPFLEIIKMAAGITEGDTEAESWIKLVEHVTRLFPGQVDEVVPYLAMLLALPVQGEYEQRVRYLDGEALGRQIFRASRWYFERLTHERPLVLVVEDMQWIDESSGTLLEHLLPVVRSAPLLAIGVSRPEQETPAARLRDLVQRGYSDLYTEITLSPLSEGDATMLARNLLQIELPPSLLTLILQKAEGNPFFVEEVIRSLIDQKAVDQDPVTGRWRVTTQLEQVTIPDTLRGVILARIDRLEEEVKQVLRMASVIGRSFFYRVLREITEAGKTLDRNLQALQHLELIREKKRIPELEYIFKHALTQEAVYESVLLRRRRELHRRVAETIEALFADRLEEFYSLLAHHYVRAEEGEKAQQYLLKAGDQAGRIAADAEALSHYQQALAASTRLFGDRWDPVQRAQLERKMGEALYRRGEHGPAMEHLERALKYLGHPFPATEHAVRSRIFVESLRHVVRRIASRGPHAVRTNVDPRADELVRTYLAMGWIDFWAQQERLLLETLLMLAFSERAGDATGIAYGFVGVGLAFDELGIFPLAASYHRRALALASQFQHPFAAGLARLGMGLHTWLTGHWDRSRVLYLEGAEIYRQAGDLKGWAIALGNHAWSLYPCGEISAALSQCGDIQRVGQDTRDRQILAWATGMIGRGLLLRGDFEAAEAHLASADEQFRQIPDHRWTVIAISSLALCAVRQGRVREALTLVREAEEVAARHRLRGLGVMLLRFAGAEACLAALEQAAGRDRSVWLERARHACRVLLWYSRFAEMRPVASRLRGTLEWIQRSSGAMAWWERSLRAADQLGARYELARTHLEIGRRLGDRRHLERAEELVAQMGLKAERIMMPSA